MQFIFLQNTRIIKYLPNTKNTIKSVSLLDLANLVIKRR